MNKLRETCPNCGNKLRYNYDKRRWECPVFWEGMTKRSNKGCGYILDQQVLISVTN
mgnify:CR=1 FL=1